MYRYNDKSINKHYIYLDDNYYPLLLPCLFARYTQVLNYRVESKSQQDLNLRSIIHTLEEKEIGPDLSYKICNHLGRFLEWLNVYDGIEQVNCFSHTALPDLVINEYINEYLIDECSKSEFVVNQAINSLNAYYDWLAFFLGNNRKYIGIKTEYREAARNNNKGSLSVNYLLPQTRQYLYLNANSLLQEIVLRNGGELGCRTRENRGLLLRDFKAHQRTHSGLLTLFEQLESSPGQDDFKYHLSSLYAKYGRSRMLYIPRNLLEKMKEYYELERPSSNSNHLLLAGSGETKGQCIDKSFGSNTFLEVRRKVIAKVNEGHPLYTHMQELKEGNVYHHLRHSFGTDIFYNLCEGQNKNCETITTTSGVYLETARRLGHQVEGPHSGETTKRYIHSCGYRERMLKDAVNG
jgi:integrase